MSSCHPHRTTELGDRIIDVADIILDFGDDIGDKLLVERTHRNLTGFNLNARRDVMVRLLGPFQDFPDAKSQYRQTKRFGDVVGSPLFESLHDILLATLGRKQDNRNMRIVDITLDLAEQLEAVHHRHHHVADDKTHVLVLCQDIEGFLTIGSNEHLVFILKTTLEEEAGIGIVLHHQNGGLVTGVFVGTYQTALSGLIDRCPIRVAVVFLRLHHRQHYSKDTAPWLVIGHSDLSPHHLHIQSDDMQTQSAALLFLAVSLLHEAVEDMFLIDHSYPCVGHADDNLPMLFLTIDSEREHHLSVVDIVFVGIRQQIRNHALQFVLIEVDFYGGGSGNAPVPRLRHGYGEISFGNSGFSILGGQTWDLISPLVTPTLNAGVLNNSGDAGLRRAQLRLTEKIPVAGGSLDIAAAVVRTIGENQPYNTSSASETGVDANIPTFQGRIGISVPLWVENKKFGLGVSGHYGQEEIDLDDTGRTKDIPTWSVNVDLTLPIVSAVTLLGEWFIGANLDTYAAGIGRGFVSDKENPKSVKSIGAVGGWVALQTKFIQELAFNVGVGLDKLDRDDVKKVGGREQNLSIFANTTYNLTSAFSLGFEYLHVQTDYRTANTVKEAYLNRYQLSATYGF